MGLRQWLLETNEHDLNLMKTTEIGDMPLFLKFKQLADRNIAVKVYWKEAETEIWLCSSEVMVSKMKKDDPLTNAYTLDEIRKLIGLDSGIEKVELHTERG
jgi:hypothetical protein